MYNVAMSVIMQVSTTGFYEKASVLRTRKRPGSPRRITHWLQSLPPAGLWNGESEAVCQHLDTNHDGWLTSTTCKLRSGPLEPCTRSPYHSRARLVVISLAGSLPSVPRASGFI